MSVRQSLLAILDQGPCYGYQLRAEFDRRTGSTWPLNVGQIYNTLDRLERDGLVAKGETDAQGHVYWEITDAGRTEVRDWLAAPVERTGSTRDELAVKLAVAATLPGVDVSEVVRVQREASIAQSAEWDALRADADADDLPRVLVLDALVARAEAEVLWLDGLAGRFSAHPPQPMALAADKPARGRPKATAR